MKVDTSRTVDPFMLDHRVRMDNDDILAAFPPDASPELDQLYYDTFGPGAARMTPPEYTRNVARIQELALEARATSMKFTDGTTVPKVLP